MAFWLNRLSAIIVLIAVGVTIVLAAESMGSDRRILSLQDGKKDPLSHANLLIQKSDLQFPSEWIETANRIDNSTPEHVALRIRLLRTALSEGVHAPHAWAQLAFLETLRAGHFSAPSARALTESIAQCAYCSKSLLRWRLTFVLNHWDEVSEETRKMVFNGADLLRWWYLDSAFLAAVRTDAIDRGIPYDAYRSRVNTPVRPNEIRHRPDAS